MGIVEKITDMATGLVVFVVMAVVGFGIFYTANTTGWDTTVVSVWNYIPLIFIVGGIIGLLVTIKYKK